MMQLAISGTEITPEEPLHQLLSPAKELGIDFVELWYPRNTCGCGLEETLSRIASAGLQIACISTGAELYRAGGSLDDQQLLLEAIRIAGRAGAPIVNTYFGYDHLQDDARAISTYQRLLEPCLREALKQNVTIVLENEFNAFGHDPVQSDVTRRPFALRTLFETIGDRHFRANFDACNFYCAGIEPYPYAYEILAPFIAYCHVKDGGWYEEPADTSRRDSVWRRFTDFDRQYIMRPLGQGAVPWHGLLHRLQADGYRGFLVLEPHAETHHRLAAWRQAANYVRNTLPSNGNPLPAPHQA